MAFRRALLYRSIQHGRLTLLRHQLLKIGHDFIPTRQHSRDFIFSQVTLGPLRKRLAIQNFQLFQQLAVTAYQIRGTFQVLGSTEGTSEINPPYLPILADEDIARESRHIVVVRPKRLPTKR
jgi:hypothetical protein